MLHTLKKKKKNYGNLLCREIGNVANNVDEHFKTNFVTNDL